MTILNEGNGTFVTHAMAGRVPLTTLCGQEYRYEGPVAHGLQKSGAIDCEECRILLQSLSFTCTVADDVRAHSRKV